MYYFLETLYWLVVTILLRRLYCVTIYFSFSEGVPRRENTFNENKFIPVEIGSHLDSAIINFLSLEYQMIRIKILTYIYIYTFK